MNVRRTKLQNGTNVITSPLPHVQSVAFGIWVGAGARYETEEMSGVSHFIEHLLFKGTRTRSSKEITQAIEGRGGYLNGFTQEESTCYYARVPYDHLWSAVETLTDVYLNPKLDPGDIAKERGVIVEEIMMYRDQPQHLVQEMISAALWKDHPLGRSIVGSPESLAAIGRREIVGYKRRTYVPGRTVFAFAGRVNHEECVDRVRRLMGRLAKQAAPRCQPVSRAVAQDRFAFAVKEIEQTHLALGFRLFGCHDSRRYALRLLNAVLGENMSSRLFQIVREKHGLAYSIQSSFQLFRESGALVVSAGLDRKRHVGAIGLVLRELDRMRRQPVGAGELKRAKDYSIGQLRLGLESTSTQMMWIGENMMSHGRFIPPEETIDTLKRVTAGDVQRLANQVIRKSCMSLALLAPALPAGEKREIREFVRRF